MQDHEAVVLRRRIASSERGRGKRYPAALREQSTRWAQGQVAAGASVRAVAAALGINAESIRRWIGGDRNREAASGLVPVEVVADATSGTPAQTLTVISPAGFRVEGLSIAAAAALLREIG